MKIYEGCPRPTDTLLAGEWIIGYIFLDNLPPLADRLLLGGKAFFMWGGLLGTWVEPSSRQPKSGWRAHHTAGLSGPVV